MFCIDGPPVPWKRPERDQRSGRTFTNPKAEAGKRAIVAAARAAWGNEPPACGPVIVRVVAIFAIPPSWPKALRAAALEARVMHISDPDIDQLVKLVMDGLVDLAFWDDNQVCGLPSPAKRYGHPERTEVTIEVLDQRSDEVTPGQRRLEAEVLRLGVDGYRAHKAGVRNRSKTKRRAP
jgi:Holliday junction resolvase RusA-like endonuclease